MEWTKINTIHFDENFSRLRDKILLNSLYEAYLAEYDGIKYYIIVSDNGGIFKPHANMAVNFIVQGKEMPHNHIHSFFRNDYSEKDIYLSNVFCVFDSQEKKERIEYIKLKAIELSNS